MVTHFSKKQKGSHAQILLWLGALALVGLGVYLVITDVRMYYKRQELNAQIQTLKNKVAEVQGDNAQLQEGISQSDNAQYIEKVAREELDMQQPGEKVISFVQPQNQQPQPAAVQQNVLQVWLGAFLNLFKK